MKNIVTILLFLLIISCSRNIKHIETNTVETKDILVNNNIEDISTDQKIINITWDNYDWLTEFDWALRDGRDYVDPSADYIYWTAPAPIIKIHKLEIPLDCNLYQRRLRNEYFNFYYQLDTVDKLYPLDNIISFGKNLDLEFRNNYSELILRINGSVYTVQDRIGDQINNNFPLVGVWGKLPTLSEYRLIDFKECVYYMEIINKIPRFAIRQGTYLLKKTGEKSFETISAFPDGQLRLEFIDDYSMLITPLFTLPDDEEGIVGHLIMNYYPDNPRFKQEE